MSKSRASINEASLDADQVEAAAVRYSAGTWVPLTWSLRDEQIADTLELNVLPGSVPLTSYAHPDADAELDSRVSSVALEILRRQRLLGDKYPFELNADKTSIRHKPSQTFVYEFCLAVSMARDLSSEPYNQLPRNFERLTAHTLQAFLGEGAESMRTAWPPDEDRPSTFKATIALLHQKTKEWKWQPLDPVVDEPRAVKDGGVDVVVWKYPDQRIGGLVLIGQCACGNDWPSKLTDLNTDRLSIFIHSISIAKQIRCLSIPFHIPDDRQWIESSAEAHLILDRVRLTLIAENTNNIIHITSKARRSYKELSDLVLPPLPNAVPTTDPLSTENSASLPSN